MKLLISESPPVEAGLGRAIPWEDDLDSYLTALAADEECREHEGRIVAGRDPAWYEPRLAALRQAILGIL
jgi:hypothetical protein